MTSDSAIKVSRMPRIGHYQPIARIATGGMGAVYKAVDLNTDREVALKVLTPEWTTKPVLLRRFELEAFHGQQLAEHPNVVTLYESGQSNGIHFLALEFVDGVDLKDYAAGQDQIDVSECLEIITQAARAINHLYKHGITHRDIKPSNFLISQHDGKPFVKLIDLGLARNAEDDEECRVTRPGTTLGTVDYIAPEQARDSGTADVRSDIYALGCTWYHLLAGRPPFPDGSVTERILQHVEVEPPNIRSLNPSAPDAMAEALHRMLAKDPADRQQTPAQLIRELESLKTAAAPVAKDLLAGLANGQRTSPESKPARPRRRSTGSSQVLRVFQDENAEVPERRKRPRRRRRLAWWFWPTVVGVPCFVFGLAAILIHLRSETVSPVEAPTPPPPAATAAPPIEPLPYVPPPVISQQPPSFTPPPPPTAGSPKVPPPPPDTIPDGSAVSPFHS